MEIDSYKIFKGKETLLKDHPKALQADETISFSAAAGSTYFVKMALKDDLQSYQAENMQNAAKDGAPLVCDCKNCDKTATCSNRH
jgi:hypothetical protein